MIIVSDTSSLNYLLLIGQVHILPSLFGKVYVPPAVIDEMQHERAPAVVQQWANIPPSWLIVQPPKQVLSHAQLGAGELESMALASELSAAALLIDDRKAAREAQSMGLSVLGTLNILKSAAGRKLLNLPEAIAALRQTSFRYSQKLIDEILRGE